MGNYLRVGPVLTVLAIVLLGLLPLGRASTPATVTAQVATKLAFTAQPSDTTADTLITTGVQVVVQDASGNTVTSASRIGSPVPSEKPVSIPTVTLDPLPPSPPPGCAPWPAELGLMLAKLPVVEGLCLRREPGPAPSSYDTSTRTIVYRSPSPSGGELGSLGHEIAHAHQHQTILDAGLPNPRHGGEFTARWALETVQGRSFVELTGWQFADGRWTAQCEGDWWCGFPNPLEDAATFLEFWFNPGQAEGPTAAVRSRLEGQAPRRSAWANTLLVTLETTISGTVTLQGRSASFPAGVGHGIARVTLNPGNITVKVGADGTLQLAKPPTGTYTLTASAPGYVSRQRTIVVAAGSPVTVPSVQLRCGLVNNDIFVNINDITATVAAFGTSPTNRVDAQGRFVDQNGDGFVNINDITCVVSGFGTTSPMPWP